MQTTIRFTATQTFVDDESVNIHRETIAMAMKKHLFGEV